jgi:hypothetical protein
MEMAARGSVFGRRQGVGFRPSLTECLAALSLLARWIDDAEQVSSSDEE